MKPSASAAAFVSSFLCFCCAKALFSRDDTCFAVCDCCSVELYNSRTKSDVVRLNRNGQAAQDPHSISQANDLPQGCSPVRSCLN